MHFIIFALVQACQTGGAQAAFGPFEIFWWPVKFAITSYEYSRKVTVNKQKHLI
jgi:hypothetical protein